jgi:hypothetical protein
MASLERPNDFWKRVKPSPLMAMLTINMCNAADKALSRGRVVDAAAKYNKAIHYIEPSLRQYADDAEMKEWTEKQLDNLKLKLSGLIHPSLSPPPCRRPVRWSAPPELMGAPE